MSEAAKENAKNLLGPGLTLVGWLTPVTLSLIALGSSASVSPETANLISSGMWFLLAIIVLLAAHVITCVLALSGRAICGVSPMHTFLVSFSALAFSLILWILRFLWG